MTEIDLWNMAIEILKDDYCKVFPRRHCKNTIGHIITLLKKGRAYEKMWERVKELAKLNNEYHVDGYTTNLETPEHLVKTIERIEKKYKEGIE